MRRAILAALITTLFACTALGVTVLLAGWDAARTYATPTPSPNTAPKEH
jgi:hypothetical protein